MGIHKFLNISSIFCIFFKIIFCFHIGVGIELKILLIFVDLEACGVAKTAEVVVGFMEEFIVEKEIFQ